MTEYDWLLILFGAGLVVFLTSQGLARALLSLLLVWLATFAGALLYREAAFRTQAVTGTNLILVEGLMFDFLLLLFFLIGFLLLKAAFPVTRLPNIGALDYIVAFFVAIIVVFIIIALLANSLGVMIREQWPGNSQGWVSLQWRFSRSGLLQYSRALIPYYGWTFSPFFPGLPPVLVAQ